MSTGGKGSESLAWRVIAVMGLSLFVAGIADLGLGLFPLRFGVPEWEFGSVSNLLNRLPLLGLGLTFTLSSSLARRRVVASYLWASTVLFVAIIVFVLGLLYATNLPLLVGSVAGGPARPVLEKGIAKSIAQIAVFFLSFLLVAGFGIRAAGRIARRSR
jgi:hypothetical protein